MPSKTVAFHWNQASAHCFLMPNGEIFRCDGELPIVHDCGEIAAPQSCQGVAGRAAGVAHDEKIGNAARGDGSLVRGEAEELRRSTRHHLIERPRRNLE